MPPALADTDLSLTQTTPQSSADKQSAPATTAKFDPLVGATLAERYEIVRRIGEGGMGAVYEARHSIIGKRVAIKVLLEKFLENEELIARLLQEARLASSIGHQNIVDVTDFGTTRDGRAFVVMEFLEGESLSQLILRDAPLPVERSLGIVKQVASALGAAHAKGIVHRDVKPENVYLVRRGEQDFVKVVDFGVSKAVRSREEAGSEWQRLTRTGAVLGTPLFMSPEQAAGSEDIDERADIWATALILYECLTGELPFRGNNYLGVVAQIQNQEVQPPSALRPELGHPARRGPRGHARSGEGSGAALPADGAARARHRSAAGRRRGRRACDEGAAGRPMRGRLAAGGRFIWAWPPSSRLGSARRCCWRGPGPRWRSPRWPCPGRSAPRAAAPTAQGRRPAPARGRRGLGGHAGRAGAASGQGACGAARQRRARAAATAKKSKADDKIAPSPYTAPQVP